MRPQLFVVVDSALISKLYYQNEPHGIFLIVPFSDHYIQIHEYNFNPYNSFVPDGNVCFHGFVFFFERLYKK